MFVEDIFSMSGIFWLFCCFTATTHVFLRNGSALLADLPNLRFRKHDLSSESSCLTQLPSMDSMLVIGSFQYEIFYYSTILLNSARILSFAVTSVFVVFFLDQKSR